MKITQFNGAIAEAARENYLIVTVTDSIELAEVKLLGYYTLIEIQEQLKLTGLYTDESDLIADSKWCKQILNKEKEMTIANNNEVPPIV